MSNLWKSSIAGIAFALTALVFTPPPAIAADHSFFETDQFLPSVRQENADYESRGGEEQT